jgi:hypothetical protein
MRAMLDVDWNLALARLNFMHGYLREMRKEVAVKNEELLSNAPGEARQAPAPAPRQPWPARRRFWHRAFHRPAHAPAPAPARPQAAEPAEATAAR